MVTMVTTALVILFSCHNSSGAKDLNATAKEGSEQLNIRNEGSPGRAVMLREGEGDYLMINTGRNTVSCTRNLELAQW